MDNEIKVCHQILLMECALENIFIEQKKGDYSNYDVYSTICHQLRTSDFKMLACGMMHMFK